MARTTPTDRWRVPGDWRGDVCFIICGGPSVSDHDLSRLSGRRVIAINSSMFTYPSADYGIFADHHWWTEWKSRAVAEFQGRVVTMDPMRRGIYLHLLHRARQSGLTRDPRYVAVWHTTTTAAINLACHLLDWSGEIGLLGLDGEDRDGRSWHHDPHPEGWPRSAKRYHFHGLALQAVADFLAATGVRAYNCNPRAAHRMFPHRSFEEMTA